MRTLFLRVEGVTASSYDATAEAAMTQALYLVPNPRSDLGSLVEDYLSSCRARGLSPATIKNSLGRGTEIAGYQSRLAYTVGF